MRNETLKLLPIARSKYTNQLFMKETGIDLAKSKGEIFTGKYTKKENENDIFLFLQGRNLLAVLKGTKEIKTSLYTYYSFAANKKANWKKLKEESNLTIIRVPEKELTYKKTKKVKEKELTLRQRLEKYKKEKYSWLTLEGMEAKLERILKAALKVGLNGATPELEKELKKSIWYYHDSADVLKHITEITREIKRYKDADDWGKKYSQGKINQFKVELIQLEKTLDKHGYIDQNDFVIEMD